MLIGALVAYCFYIVNPEAPGALARQQPVLYRFLLNKWYFDEIYDFLFVRPAIWLGDLLWKGGDGEMIDGSARTGSPWASCPGSPARRAGAVRLSLPLCLRDGARGWWSLTSGSASPEAGDEQPALAHHLPAADRRGGPARLPAGRGRDGAAERQAARALHHQRHFLLSLFLIAGFDPSNPGFQFVEERPWFGGLTYRMGVDGISVLFVMLTTFLMPL